MGQPWFLRVLIVSCFLAMLFSQGFGRNLIEKGDSSIPTKGIDQSVRKMYEVMDYQDPEPNVNPRTGHIFTPPPSPPQPYH